ncbi:hypothetical protein BJF78_04155 [Pseudonocardia sp. CNS-139]|nr:hypothetical protein BJF78_04155 [Pseudonocardia sp. CNS-139]
MNDTVRSSTFLICAAGSVIDGARMPGDTDVGVANLRSKDQSTSSAVRTLPAALRASRRRKV